MKQTVQMNQIQERMQPGVYTRDGFLGTDRRKLIDILLEDDEAVKRMDLTHRQIADRMIELRDAGMRGLGEFINVEPHYEIRVISVRVSCPVPSAIPEFSRKQTRLYAIPSSIGRSPSPTCIFTWSDPTDSTKARALPSAWNRSSWPRCSISNRSGSRRGSSHRCRASASPDWFSCTRTLTLPSARPFLPGDQPSNRPKRRIASMWTFGRG